jgi:hypothetical protein
MTQQVTHFECALQVQPGLRYPDRALRVRLVFRGSGQVWELVVQGEADAYPAITGQR